MKKLNLLLLSFVAFILFSCEEKKPEVPNIVPVDELPAIVEAHGRVGEGTSMNVIEFINDEGDTLYIYANSHSIMGGLAVGDELKIIYNVKDDDLIASMAVNLTALQHVWSQRGADGKEQSLEIDEKGRATTYDMSVEYESWDIENGLLLLRVPKKIGDESPAIVDTFEIMQLTPDSLVLMNGDFVSEFERYN
ncbi:MAG: hypothetical protein KBT33_10890 [Prevotellaceae bacterium]|nr:hypothetical protein [Candidatus Minthosoma equi]